LIYLASPTKSRRQSCMSDSAKAPNKGVSDVTINVKRRRRDDGVF
jgi:hypothetical protein